MTFKAQYHSGLTAERGYTQPASQTQTQTLTPEEIFFSGFVREDESIWFDQIAFDPSQQYESDNSATRSLPYPEEIVRSDRVALRFASYVRSRLARGYGIAMHLGLLQAMICNVCEDNTVRSMAGYYGREASEDIGQAISVLPLLFDGQPLGDCYLCELHRYLNRAIRCLSFISKY